MKNDMDTIIALAKAIPLSQLIASSHLAARIDEGLFDPDWIAQDKTPESYDGIVEFGAYMLMRGLELGINNQKWREKQHD